MRIQKVLRQHLRFWVHLSWSWFLSLNYQPVVKESQLISHPEKTRDSWEPFNDLFTGYRLFILLTCNWFAIEWYCTIECEMFILSSLLSYSCLLTLLHSYIKINVTSHFFFKQMRRREGSVSSILFLTFSLFQFPWFFIISLFSSLNETSLSKHLRW